MPRSKCRRNISYLPRVTYFKPAGVQLTELEEVILEHDELEAIRLKDLFGLTQEDAARQMNVSQPTFHRLLLSAREKIANAIVNGRALRIEGGNVTIEERFIPPCGWRLRCRHGWRDGSGIIKNRRTQAMERGGTMRIAVTSSDGTMEGMVDERFGRCRKLIIYDSETKTHTVVDNELNMGTTQGAGIQTAQNVINSGARVVISGHLGPNAYRVLQAAGVEVYTASNMRVAEAIAAFEKGRLSKLPGPDVEGHW